MGTLLSLVGLVVSILMIKYRERVGENIGEAAWMEKIGGVYNAVILLAVFIFFWSIAYLTGTTGILFAPLGFIFSGLSLGGN